MQHLKRAVPAFVGAVLLFASPAWSQVPTHQWSQRFGELLEDSGRALASDATGNLYVTGWVRGDVDFGGGSLVAGGGTDVYVAKFDPAGVHLWSRRTGGGGDQTGYAIATPPSGVIVAGEMAGTADFGGGPLSSAGNGDAFLARYDPLGGHIWSLRFGSTGFDRALGVAADAAGDLFVVGAFSGTVDFGGGGLTSAGGFDGFVAKYSGAGTHLWSRRFGDVGFEHAWGVAVNVSGDVFVTGNFGGTVDFGGGGLTSAGSADIFLVSYGGDGAHIWSRRFGSGASDQGQGVVVGGSGSVFVTGYFGNTVDFGGGGLMSAGSADIFVAAYDASGSHQWSRRSGGTEFDAGFDLAADAAGGVVATGVFRGTADFGNGPYTSAGTDDVFAAGYDAAGNHVWSARFGDSGADEGLGIGIDAGGNVLLSGQFEGTVDFGGGGLTSVDDGDIFVAKFGDAPNTVAIASFTARVVPQGIELRGVFSSDLAITGANVYRGESPWSGLYVHARVAHADGTFIYRDGTVEPGRVYRYQIGVVDGDGEFLSPVVEVSTPGRETALLQNRPNPFNPSTTIHFELGEQQPVVVRVYDVHGRVIRTLLDETRAAGPHAIPWDGTDDRGHPVGSGVYYYRMTAGKERRSRSMVLLK